MSKNIGFSVRFHSNPLGLFPFSQQRTRHYPFFSEKDKSLSPGAKTGRPEQKDWWIATPPKSACHRPSFLDFLHFCGIRRIHSPSIHCFRLLRPCPTHKGEAHAARDATPRHGDGRPLPASTVADCVCFSFHPARLSLLATTGGPLPPLNA